MSANIMWRAVKPGTDLNVGHSSDFASRMNLPRIFTSKDYQFLMGAKAGNPSWEKAIDGILEAIEKHHEIEVYAEY